MNITDETLEILIGKYIDGEITPSEQGMLDGAMEKDSKVKELLEQLTELHEASTDAIGSEVLDQGKSADEIIDLAWGGGRCAAVKRPNHGWVRFAAGLAAGLLIGLTIHFALSNSPQSPREEARPGFVASGPDERMELRMVQPPAGNRVIRNVDYYGFTDKQGGRWVVEGLREDMVRPAVYYGDL